MFWWLSCQQCLVTSGGDEGAEYVEVDDDNGDDGDDNDDGDGDGRKEEGSIKFS